MIGDFITLLFPDVCASCGDGLGKHEESICLNCLYHLPKTNFHVLNDNPVAKLFWGRVNIEKASAFYRFDKGSKVQHLIHQLKYRGKKEVGVKLGKLYGAQLLEAQFINGINTIIPVPLHAKKMRKRGFNQSSLFAEGLSASTSIESNNDILFRKNSSSTQTKKSRFNRWTNVESIFEVENADLLKGKHILLVDDVVTTGSTIEACAKTLLSVSDVKVSVVTIAFAEM